MMNYTDIRYKVFYLVRPSLTHSCSIDADLIDIDTPH
jgi:hypothetical protein